MKTIKFLPAFAVFTAMLFIISCTTPVKLTSWKNPEVTGTVSKIVVVAVFDKLGAVEPVETQCAAYFSGKNLTTVRALDIMNPFKQYSREEIQRKVDSVGADGFLILIKKTTDVSVNYYPGFYGGYWGYWGYGGNWSVDQTFNVRAMLYATKSNKMLWSGDLAITNPNDINSAAQKIAQVMFNDWIARQLLKNPPPPVTK